MGRRTGRTQPLCGSVSSPTSVQITPSCWSVTELSAFSSFGIQELGRSHHDDAENRPLHLSGTGMPRELPTRRAFLERRPPPSQGGNQKASGNHAGAPLRLL